MPLDFGDLTGDDIQGTRDLTGSQIDLAVGCNIATAYNFEQGRLVELTNIEIIDHVASIYSDHAIISKSSSDDEKEAQAATVKEDPKPKSVTYNGSAQELVTAGTAEGGTMQYALGTNATTAPTTGYTTSIPTATDAGTYYVWYKAVGDANHTDSEPASVTVTVAEKKQETKEIRYYYEIPFTVGEVKDITGTGEATAETNPYGTKVVNSASFETLLKIADAEKATGVTVWLDVQDGALTVPETDKAKILSAAGGYTVGQYLDINLFKKVGNNDPVQVHETSGKVKVSIVIPVSLRKDGRTFRILKVHNGVVSAIDGTYDASTGIFTFETDSFSSYAIAYKDAKDDDELFFLADPRSGRTCSERDGSNGT